MVQTDTVVEHGQTFTTTYSYHPSYVSNCDAHRPYQVVQSGDLTRTSTTAYTYPTSLYRLDLVSSTSTTVGTESMETDLAYDSLGFPTSRTTAGVQTQFAPNSAGNVASITDADGHTSTFTYSYGAASSTHTPLYTLTRTLNSDGSVASETRRGLQTTYAYDPAGRPVSVTSPGRDPIAYAYTATTTTVTQGSSSVRTELDGFGRNRGVTDAIGVGTSIEYNADGQVTRQVLPSFGATTASETYAYNDLGQVDSVSHSAGGTASTVDSGSTVVTTDENGHSTTAHYQLFAPGDGRMTALTDPAGQTWTYGYNGFGSLTSVSEPGGLSRAFTYDARNRLVSETHPESGTTTYTYDDAGNVLTKTDANGTTLQSVYDANNRLVGVTGVAGDSVTMAYDDSDNRTSLTNGTAMSTWTYDSANRVTSRADMIAGHAFTTSYAYDGRDELLHITYPSGRVVSYAYDLAGRITQVSDNQGHVFASNIAYHPSGAATSIQFGNGTQETTTIDGRYRPTARTSGPLSVGYAYDPAGNVTGITDARQGFSSTFQYDALDRLRFVTGFGADEYQYDARGNRTYEATGNVTSTYGSHERLFTTSGTSGSTTFGYDAVGNLTSQATSSYTYTPFNRMRTAHVDGVDTVFGYDGDQDRVVRTDASGTIYSIRGPGGVLAEYEDAGDGVVLTREYVYLGGQLLASVGRPDTATPPAVAVSLTAPSAGAVVNQGTTLTLSAQPYIGTGSVASVEFYANGALLGTATNAPYTFSTTSLAPGSYRLLARVITNSGAVAVSASVPVTIVHVDAPPVVTLTSPSNGAAVGTGRTVTLTATASDADGISKVEFYRGSFLLATDTAAPYTFDWTNVPTGAYVITAKAYDALGATTISAPASLSVSPIATVTINPVSPTAGNAAVVTVNGAAFCTSVNVDFGDGNLQTFLNGSGLPISNTHAWATTGAKTVTATGLGGDCDDTAATSATVLTAPVVGLYAPGSGTIYTAPATIAMGASAYPGQGTVASVAFYANGSLVATTPTSPYQFAWTGVPNGTYALTAVATDTAGAVATSSSVNVVVGAAPPSTVLGVTVSPTTVASGQAATVTVTGTNPCDMLWMDFGDGDWWIAPISGGLPHQISKTWTTPGTYTVLAKGFSSCTGQATTTVTVTGEAPGPDADVPPAAILEPPVVLPTNDALMLEADGPDAPVASLTDAEGASSLIAVTIYVDLNGSGGGSVTGSASCTGTTTTRCAASVADGVGLTLTAAPAAGSVFTGWSGVCAGTTATCTLTAFDHALAVANFRAAPAPVLQYYHMDTLGSVRAVTDASGTVLERHDYRPFGEDNQALPAPGANSARFLGQQRDQTKLDYFGARYLDMHTGRFTGVDPVLSPAALVRPQKFNRYAYAENNPLRFADATGMDDWDDQMAANMDSVNRTIEGMGDLDGNQVIPIGPCSEECQSFNRWHDDYMTNVDLNDYGGGGQGGDPLTYSQIMMLPDTPTRDDLLDDYQQKQAIAANPDYQKKVDAQIENSSLDQYVSEKQWTGTGYEGVPEAQCPNAVADSADRERP